MADTIGKWNPAWGPEPTWQGPARKRPKYRLRRLTCPCTPEVVLVYGSEGPQVYVCASCGEQMAVAAQEDARRVRESKIKPGDRYGRLVVTALLEMGGQGRRVLCRCDCGAEKEVWAKHLRDASTRSCGCFRRERLLAHRWKEWS